MEKPPNRFGGFSYDSRPTMEDTKMEPENHPQTTWGWARHYIENEGFAVLPALPGEKEARVKGWPQLVIGPEAIDEYFPPGETRNVTRVNGTNSGGRGDIDLDHPAALRVANYLVPDSIRRFSREVVLGHIEIRFLDHCPRTIKYELPGAGEDRMVVELRSDGSQTLLPPSTYPNGDRCVWRAGEVYEAHTVSIRALASDIAIASVLYMYYPGEGRRHSFWLGAVGMLVRSKYPAERIRRIIGAVCRAANDPEIEDRTKVLDTTITKFMVGEKIGGKRQIKVAPEVPEVLKDWLGKDAMHDSDLPQIVVNDRPLREVSDAAVDGLLAANDPPDLYTRSGGLARLNVDNEGE